MTVGTRLQLRRNTAANWVTDNPVLLAGELGVETDTGSIKVGDGTTVWNVLGYVNRSQIAPLNVSLAALPFVSFTDARVGGVMDGATDNGASGTNALANAFTLLGANGGTIYVPPGTAKFATAPGVNVPGNIRIVGAGKNATIFKKTYNGALLSFVGASTASRCSRSGLADIQLNGNTTSTGALIVATYADHLNFERVWCNLNADCAVVATELWDTYFNECEFEWCGTSTVRTGAVVRLLGSATDSTNEIYFTKCRWESFPHNALYADSNSNITHAPYGIWLSQCKMESAQMIGGATGFIDMTNDVVDFHIRDIYLAADALGGGGGAGTLINLVGSANITVDGVHAYCASGTTTEVVRVFPGIVGHSIKNVFVDAPAGCSSGIVNFAGGSPQMTVENVTYKVGQSGKIFGGTIPATAKLIEPAPAARWTADTLGLTNGTAVTTIPDVTGNQGTFNTPSGTVTQVTNAQNGLSIVRLAASAGMTLSLTTPTKTPYTLFAAIKSGSAGQTATVLNINGLQFFLSGSVWDMNAGTDLTGGTEDAVFHVFTFLVNGATSKLKMDGKTLTTGNAGSTAGTAGNLAGALAGGTAGMDIGELVLYGFDATGTDEETRLRRKWGTA